ncbi:MAG: hypothetical protein WD046_13885 [Paracoccaceae bacterium]
MQIEEIITRLKAQVASFQSRIEAVADLSSLVKGGRLPNRTPSAYVLPLGLQALAADIVAGMYRQGMSETFGVVIITNAANDARGAAGVPDVTGLRDQVIAALAGWGSGAVVLEVLRGRLVSLNAGMIIYQLEFKTTFQIRIAR